MDWKLKFPGRTLWPVRYHFSQISKFRRQVEGHSLAEEVLLLGIFFRKEFIEVRLQSESFFHNLK